ncbi:VanW family protein [Clostridium carnis]
MSENNGTNKRNYKSFFEKNKKAIIILLASIVIIIGGASVYLITVTNNVKAWETKSYPKVNVYGVEVGGLTKDEIVKTLNEKLPTLIMDKKLDISVGDHKLELKYSDINPTYNVEEISEEAIKYGKDLSLFEKNSLIKKSVNHSIEAKISYNEEKLKAFEETVKQIVNVNPQNAKISISSGNITVTPDVIGYKINEEELHKKIVENINGDPGHAVQLTFDLQESPAKIKASDLQKINGKISGYSSNYRDGGDGRVTNMRIAAETVNGTVLMPGEEFSYNALIGDTTPDKGYQKANTYVGNKIVPDYGGGICQVSTTLYRAIMRANIRSTERLNHSLTVSYSEPGLDATVAYGVVDYKFVNTYDFPIYIQGYVSGGTVGFSIYGNQHAMGGKTYELVNEVHEKYNPQVEYIDDPNMEQGTEKIEVNGMPGYKASSYQITYENGVEVNRELVATDVYLTTNTVKRRGTKKPSAPQTQTGSQTSAQ